MSENMSAFAYLIASVCFILALRGLSHPESSRRGNILGIVGMTIAIITTLVDPDVVSYPMIIAGIVIGGAIGTVVALKIQMTALPQLVAAFHSLVGLAAVFVATAALYNPMAYGLGMPGEIPAASLIEMGLGTAIGAITFSGSVIAFAKLQGVMSGAPITFPMQHMLNAGLGVLMVVLFFLFATTESYSTFWMLALLAFALGFLIMRSMMPIAWLAEASSPLLLLGALASHALLQDTSLVARLEKGPALVMTTGIGMSLAVIVIVAMVRITMLLHDAFGRHPDLLHDKE